MVLQVLREHQLYAKLIKCEVYQRKVQYLGHVISEEGIAVDPKMVEAIMDWPTQRMLPLLDLLWVSQAIIEGSLKDSPRSLIQLHRCRESK